MSSWFIKYFNKKTLCLLLDLCVLRVKNKNPLDILGIMSYHARMDFNYDKWLEEERRRY